MPDPTIAKETANILEAMTRSVLNAKPKRGTVLTPVGAERSVDATPTVTPARMPDLPTIFMPQEAIEGAVREIRKQARHILSALGAIDASLGNPAEPAEPVGPSIKEVEAAADAAHLARVAAGKEPAVDKTEADFATKFAAQQAAAQAATFKEPSGAAVAANGWVCLDHSSYVDATSPKGRKFRRCGDPTCKQFER